MRWHVTDKKCCVECFEDATLRRLAQAKSTESGACQYCKRRNRALVNVYEMAGAFSCVVDLYAPSNDGDPLIDLVQADWEPFSERLIEREVASTLLDDILLADWDDDDGDSPIISTEFYVMRRPMGYGDQFDEFIVTVGDDEGAVPEFDSVLLEDLERCTELLPAGAVLHRARIGYAVTETGRQLPWAGDAIGAPPAPPAARANRAGQHVLYLAFEERTAVAEVRPALGHVVSVAEFTLNRDIRTLDLTHTPPPINPFDNPDSMNAYWIEFYELVDRFSATLSEPLERQDIPSDYWPSQRLCQYFQDAGFHAIRYGSAMQPRGANLVLFDPTAADFCRSHMKRIRDISITYGDFGHAVTARQESTFEALKDDTPTTE